MNFINNDTDLEKQPTHIPGFDWIARGGFPKYRSTLISGTAGSSKTVFATQFLVEGVRKNKEKGLFVTFEESPEEIKKNMISFGWDIKQYEADGMWVFLDASPQPEIEVVEAGAYDMGGLLTRIEYAIKKVGASRVSLDSLGAFFSQFSDRTTVRREIFRITHALRKMNVTSIITAERIDEHGMIARFGVEEFVADNVVVLRNSLEDERRRRTIEILKFRGTDHYKGEFPFTIIPGEGIIIIPLSAIELKQKSSVVRITSGCPELDNMCAGGFYRDSIILVSGATGNGKTLMVTHFIAGGANNSEKCLIFAFEESREQLFRNAIGWGVDYEQMEKEGKLMVVCEYPETASLEDHLIKMKKTIESYKPNRIAVDSLSALERVSTIRSFREFVISITSFIKHQEIAGFFTSTTPTLLGGTSITETHISTITDTIILLRYVELYGETRRGITVLKMRGSTHDKEIREFQIDGNGMHIGKPFRNVVGILSGNPVQISPTEVYRTDELFKDR
ncbi:circadian clock protein KaiC [Candidatus Magnetominusculus xianensis]|uniref:non-specific serine/threonine protein kinase n=1 Tax=Candidatus Magnetominusculus xianensis TaxID=1748249 RepID=A0ABR5SI35_9BACT|nr:circadian clock protein KaiC [Candidatus Magnetominusculus xianensis]KWT91952.1 circadian clock protein KaiC [Candidatus Magnetominusculus xianensis]MBF0403225.1 circadian clock protein KaiC [Nitrospirota bacterium]